MKFLDQHHTPQEGRDAVRRMGAAWPYSWVDVAPGLSSQAFAEGLHGVSAGSAAQCWMSDLDTDIVVMLAGQGRPPTSPPKPDDPDPLTPMSRRRWTRVVIGLLVIAYAAMAVFTAIFAWERPESGMQAVVPVVVLGGWVILHPIVATRLRRRRRR